MSPKLIELIGIFNFVSNIHQKQKNKNMWNTEKSNRYNRNERKP